MMIKDIAVHIDQSLSINSRIDAAARIAMHFDATIRGIYTIPPNPISIYIDKLSNSSEYAHTPYMKKQLEIAAETKERFTSRLSNFEIKPLWTQRDGFFTDLLVEEFRYADLGIIGQPDEIEISEPSNRFTNNLLLQSGIPLVTVPRSGWDKDIGTRAIVAWNEQRESTRALNSALELLGHAQSVLIVTAGKDKEANIRIASRCCERLSHHGIDAQALGIECEVYDEAVELLKFASDHDGDVLIMGAWGHTRIKEAIMGGVTQTILRSTVLPLWMMH